MGITTIDVAVNVVQNDENRVLLAERTARQISAGFWELPGGKIDPGETPEQAAARELEEEIGITAEQVQPFMAYEHTFPTKRVRLFIFRVTKWRGTPHGREGQRLHWVDPTAPEVGPLLPSNLRVLTSLGLPPLMELLKLSGDASALLAHVHEALSRGVRLIQLSAPLLAPDQRVSVARRICDLTNRFGAKTLLAGSALEAGRAGATGVHSCAETLRRATARPPVRLWSVGCCNEADLARAAALGADLAVVSPVLACDTRPVLGWAGMQTLSAATTIPLYAKGGLDIAHLGQALHAGATGIVVSADHLAAAFSTRDHGSKKKDLLF